MRSAVDIASEIAGKKLIIIARGIETAVLIPALRAAHEAGACVFETTFTEPGKHDNETAERIAALVEGLPGCIIGAGTVLTLAQLELAHAAGAEFIVSPDFNPAIVKRTKELGMVSVPGAYTPTEVIAAHFAGADFVKLFPANADYLHIIRAPIPYIKLVAVGGVSAATIPALMKAGASAVAVGSEILCEPENIDRIKRTTAGIIKAIG